MEEQNKDMSMEDFAAALDQSFRRINPGDKMTGTVVGIEDDRVTLDLGTYAAGVIYKEDVSDDPDYSIRENFELNQSVEAEVVAADDGHGNIKLSLKKAAAEKSWDRLKTLLESKENVSVKISGITKGGAVCKLEGVRGFIPASKLALGYVSDDDLTNFLNKTIEVRVITADEDGKRLVLSAKDILREKEAEERKEKAEAVKVGSIFEGTVETLKDYGAFVRLENGTSGLLHVSQISNKRIKSPSVVLSEGQKVRVKVIAVKDGKISLSMKALEEAEPTTEETEHIELPKAEEIGTSLGSLLKGLKL